MKISKILRLFLVTFVTTFSFGSYAATQQVNFTLDDGAGNNATGFITYDDSVVTSGQAISGGGICTGPDNSIDYQINISGGSLGTVSFNKASCSSRPAFCNVPDFTRDVNFFGCSAGGATGGGSAPNTFSVTKGGVSADLIFRTISAPTPASPPVAAPIPTLSEWAMIFLACLMGLFAYSRMRRQN
jgi:hypothetical protein